MKKRIELAKARAYYQWLCQQEELTNIFREASRNHQDYDNWVEYNHMWECCCTDMMVLETKYKNQLGKYTWLDKLIVYFFGK